MRKSETHTLLTDLYQLTMAAGYWRSGKANQEAVFHLFFRSLPFAGGYAVTSGLAQAVEWLEGFRFEGDELEYLARLEGGDGNPLFESAFLDYLGELRWSCDLDAMPEGSLVFAHEPIVRVRGPLLAAQLAETALLNVINFQTLIATKAARICEAAQGDPVLEFGLRRAQGPNGGTMASRAAFIGGCTGTSNVLAGHLFGIPVRGTHAHSWVLSFDSEIEAFRVYAEAMPANCVFLVDTFDSLEGVDRAIEQGKSLRQRGHELAGIRLDSGDLAWLSIEARRRLDTAGFPEARIVASNNLDEFTVESLKHQGARIDVWGVGTQLATGGDQPALGGVYKLSAIRGDDGTWNPKLKLSETAIKVNTPGIHQVRRFERDGLFRGDAIYDEEMGCPERVEIVDPAEPLREKHFDEGFRGKDLLEPVFRRGDRVADLPSLRDSQQTCREQLDKLHPTIKRLRNPHAYPAGLEKGLHDRKQQLIDQARKEMRWKP